ncbi:PD-(D/E)XK motif protein [Psychromonas sp. SA13A]|uniref:PD-(D/E)XK motif protein n=1 Tax=Psychromonas sp. SA13A TaxID=2686346 RepID=UPI00140BA630|nr:PD-(D/E)XK motif protein [Psychromonas sp. SA13A]
MDYLLSWENIDNDGHSFVSGKRISTSCLPELDYGITNKKQRCLILYLSKRFSADIKEIDKLHLSLKFVKSQNAIVLTLKDLMFSNLFDDLIHSIYKEIHDKNEDKIIVQLFITTFLKWSEFFEDNNHSKMTKNEVQGLFGELHVLHQLIKNNVDNIDTLLSSWRGPYKEPHDFAFSTVDIEVKAIQSSKNTISITSEQQLENHPDKGLIISVISLNDDYLTGQTLKNKVEKIRQSIVDFHGDYSLFYKALSELELTSQNVSIYNNFKFTVISDRQFNTQIDNFPKLTSKELPKAISKLKYNLNLEQISEFEIERSYCVS